MPGYDSSRLPWEADIDEYYRCPLRPKSPVEGLTQRDTVGNEPRGPRAAYALNREKRIEPDSTREELTDRL